MTSNTILAFCLTAVGAALSGMMIVNAEPSHAIATESLEREVQVEHLGPGSQGGQLVKIDSGCYRKYSATEWEVEIRRWRLQHGIRPGIRILIGSEADVQIPTICPASESVDETDLIDADQSSATTFAEEDASSEAK